MAIAQESVKVAVCDACGKRTYADPGTEPAVISGTAVDWTSGKKKTADWSACGQSHVGNATKEALKKANVVAPAAQTWGTGS